MYHAPVTEKSGH